MYSQLSQYHLCNRELKWVLAKDTKEKLASLPGVVKTL